jgi:hypothetical protein
MSQPLAIDPPLLCMCCAKPANDAYDQDVAGRNGCCEDAEWGYCRACNVWTERKPSWSTE